MRSHPLKHMVPVGFLSAVAIMLTFGVAAAQAALIRGRGAVRGPAIVSHGPTSVGVVVLTSVILALVVALLIWAVVSGRRESAAAAGEPRRLPGRQSETEEERERKAA